MVMVMVMTTRSAAAAAAAAAAPSCSLCELPGPGRAWRSLPPIVLLDAMLSATELLCTLITLTLA